ncbi:Rossmann-like and DUF2520 domain-containing protein [Aquimarina algicola]|uniref:DUF2520 domain-containing protein n=1 Tax=Aquimarina algicola TaxID=2589995 RepID=A0A504J616_9FLAO|nr:DUF2520 domain-containing protein [Aquimarina algicola]TPN83408.1 DUF2520 domain-containing protein [Aquimarina algicola]
MIRIIILGSGNVAKHLYKAFMNIKAINVIQCYNRKGILLHPDQELGDITNDLQVLKEADLYIVAVSDDAIKTVSDGLMFNDRLVVHTSGSSPLHTLNNANKRGVFYPLQSFSQQKDIDFESIPFCLEAEHEKDLALLKKVAGSLSKNVYEISSEQRNTLHVAAVFANNFTNYLFSTAKNICDTQKVPFEILHALILETATKITEIDPDLAQTGPALRNDTKTIQRHLNTLSNQEHKNIYQALTAAIQSKHGKKL